MLVILVIYLCLPRCLINRIIIYQCYVYHTNIRHIPPEIAWACDTTSVIRRVWYDECDTMQILWGKKCWNFVCVKFVFLICFFYIFVLNFFFLNFLFEIFLLNFVCKFFFFKFWFQYLIFFLYKFIYFVATTRHTEHCATLLVAFDNSSDSMCLYNIYGSDRHRRSFY